MVAMQKDSLFSQMYSQETACWFDKGYRFCELKELSKEQKPKALFCCSRSTILQTLQKIFNFRALRNKNDLILPFSKYINLFSDNLSISFMPFFLADYAYIWSIRIWAQHDQYESVLKN